MDDHKTRQAEAEDHRQHQMMQGKELEVCLCDFTFPIACGHYYPLLCCYYTPPLE